MRTLFVVSPDYLEAIFMESKKYSFCLHGYGNFTDACKNLKYTNAEHLMGFCYVCKQVPEPGGKEFAEFERFVGLANLMQSNKKFLIVTLGSKVNLGNIPKKYKHLRFLHYCESDAITDITINKHVFGSILLDVSKPYKLKDEKTVNIAEYSNKSLKLNPIMPREYLDVFGPIHRQDNVRDTVSTDVVVNRSSGIVKLLRTIRILNKMGVSSDRVKEEFMETIREMEAKSYGIMLAMLKMVEEG